MVAIEDLNVAGMTRTPKPVLDHERDRAWRPNGRRAKSKGVVMTMLKPFHVRPSKVFPAGSSVASLR